MSAGTLMTAAQVMARLTIKKTAFYAMVNRGEVSKPIKVGGSVRWIPEEIEADLEAMKAKREQPDRVRRRGRPRKVAS